MFGRHSATPPPKTGGFNLELGEKVLGKIVVPGNHNQRSGASCVVGWTNRLGEYRSTRDRMSSLDVYRGLWEPNAEVRNAADQLGISYVRAQNIWGTMSNMSAKAKLMAHIRQERAIRANYLKWEAREKKRLAKEEKRQAKAAAKQAKADAKQAKADAKAAAKAERQRLAEQARAEEAVQARHDADARTLIANLATQERDETTV